MRSVRRARNLACSLLAAAALGFALPASASATEITIFSGFMDYGGQFGPRHSLTSVWTTWWGRNWSCINALNSGGGWAGETRCATSLDTNVGHAYCGCTLRYGFGRAYDGLDYTYANAREFY
jgi:hypothetical protein